MKFLYIYFFAVIVIINQREHFSIKKNHFSTISQHILTRTLGKQMNKKLNSFWIELMIS